MDIASEQKRLKAEMFSDEEIEAELESLMNEPLDRVKVKASGAAGLAALVCFVVVWPVVTLAWPLWGWLYAAEAFILAATVVCASKAFDQ